MNEGVVGFVGLGRMGRPMAGRLLDAGFRLVVADPSAEALEALTARGARRCSTPREIADAADVVLMSLPSPAVVREVALGADGLAGGGRMSLLIDLSTTGPAMAEEVARGIAAVGRAEMLDCPVSGGVAGAAGGRLTLMAAGSPAAIERAGPVLREFGTLRLCGDRPGHGQMVKVVNNLLSVVSMAAASEAVVLAERAGLDPARMFEVINASSGASNASMTKVPKHILPRTYDFGFSTALSSKDVRLCLQQADALGVPMLMGSTARQILAMTEACYGGDADFTNIHRLLERIAGGGEEASKE